MAALCRSTALPLFDRLRSGGGAVPRTPDDALRASIVREIAALLGTRASYGRASGDSPRGTLEYGLPDMSGFAVGHPDSAALLARSIERAVTMFEPRLAAPSVSVQPGEAPDALRVRIAGRIGESDTTLRFHWSRHAVRPDEP
jgi:type VI secretion system lysozyme-like protein